MNATLVQLAAGLMRSRPGEEGLPTDDQGITTHHALWPEGYELLFFGAAFGVIALLLAWKGKPIWAALRKGLDGRTNRIQKELDEAAKATSDAATEAARIREAKGDITAERQRMLAEADRQAAAVLEEGRVRLEQEVLDNAARGAADIVAARSRASAELRAEIASLSSAAVEQVVHGALDGLTHQQLIEAFIAKVGATHGATA